MPFHPDANMSPACFSQPCGLATPVDFCGCGVCCRNAFPLGNVFLSSSSFRLHCCDQTSWPKLREEQSVIHRTSTSSYHPSLTGGRARTSSSHRHSQGEETRTHPCCPLAAAHARRLPASFYCSGLRKQHGLQQAVSSCTDEQPDRATGQPDLDSLN